MAGLTENGLVIKRFTEILADLQNSERENIDPNISVRDDELLGQLNNIWSLSAAEFWELIQAVNDSFDPSLAEGIYLDKLATLIGISRIAGAVTQTDRQNFVGNSGVIIPASTVLENPSTLDRFVTTAAINLDTTACISATYSVANVLNNETYTITVNGNLYSYISDVDATALEIVNGLKALIDADATATWTATVNTLNSTITITSDDSSIRIDIVVLTYLSATSVTNFGEVQALEEGVIVAPPNSVVNIITPVSGLFSTTNPVAYITGRNEESDEDFRQRLLTSQQAQGTATVEAIQDRLSNVEGVTAAAVIENDQITVDGSGRPPKSFESIVQGGTDINVATAIMNAKPAGIQTFGSTSQNVTDNNGNEFTINFTRPTPVNLAFEVEYTKYSEESFPVTGEAFMAEAVLDYTNSLGLNADVIPSRYFGEIYNKVAGIDSLIVKVQQITNPGDSPLPGSWQTARLPIALDEFANTTSVDINIIEV